LDVVVPVPPLAQDDVPLNDAIEPDRDNDTDVEDELSDFDELSDEEDVFINEYLMDHEAPDQPNRTQLLCDAPEQARRGTSLRFYFFKFDFDCQL
jgi:hypothetical protein